MLNPVLELRHVDFTAQNGRPIPILQDISLKLEQGEALSILGASGVGKTTLCRLMAGIIRPTSGAVLFDGRPHERPGSHVTISFQNFPCFPWLSVEKNVLFGVSNGHLPESKTQMEYAFWLLEQVGLLDVRDARPNTLSGGMLQRLSLARALAVHPKVLILDEPFSALDAKTKADLANLILRLQDRAQFSLIVVLHSLEDAHTLTERAIVLDGRPARVSVDARISDIGFPQFQSKVLTGMTSVQTRGSSVDLADLVDCIRHGRVPETAALQECCTGFCATYLRKRTREADAPYVMRLLKSDDPTIRRFGVMLARPLVNHPDIRDAQTSLWKSEPDVLVRLDLIYNLIERQHIALDFVGELLSFVIAHWKDFSGIVEQWYGVPPQQLVFPLIAKLDRNDIPANKRSLYMLELLTVASDSPQAHALVKAAVAGERSTFHPVVVGFADKTLNTK